MNLIVCSCCASVSSPSSSPAPGLTLRGGAVAGGMRVVACCGARGWRAVRHFRTWGRDGARGPRGKAQHVFVVGLFADLPA